MGGLGYPTCQKHKWWGHQSREESTDWRTKLPLGPLITHVPYARASLPRMEGQLLHLSIYQVSSFPDKAPEREGLSAIPVLLCHPSSSKAPACRGSRRETPPRVPPVPIKEAHPDRRMTVGLRRHSSMGARWYVPSFPSYILRRRRRRIRRRRLRMVSRGHPSNQFSSTPRKEVQWKRVVIVIHPLTFNIIGRSSKLRGLPTINFYSHFQ